MRWIKKGRLVIPDGKLDWKITHAWVPFADYLCEDLYRIYFAGRNSQNLSQVGYVEIDINEPQKILTISEEPVLKLGSLGSFDDSAVLPSWIVDHKGKKYMYYIGWMQGKRVPYYASLGLAISSDGGRTFTKFSKGPLLERNDVDPYMTASACVRIEDGLWRMWYLTTIRWVIENEQPTPYYHIKYAESRDGINWKREGIVAIDFKYKGENRISRPCVIKEDNLYKMWYSYAVDEYRIGYAESYDGTTWKRKDEEVGIDVSESGWDSKMICYPFVFEHKGKKYMLYNGNDYGKTGIGYAVEEEG